MPIFGAPSRGINRIRTPRSPLAPDSAGKVRISQSYLEVVSSGIQGVRVSQQYLEVISSGVRNVRVSQQYLEVITSLDQAVLPQPLTDSDSFFVPQVTQSGSSLAPGLLNDAEVFYAPSVIGTTELTPGLYTDTDVGYIEIVSASNTLQPSAIADLDTLLSPRVAINFELEPGLIADAESFYAPVISFHLLTDTFADQDDFLTATVEAGGILVSPPRITDAESFYVFAVEELFELLPDTFTDIDVVLGASVGFQLLPDVFVDVDTVLTPALLYNATLLAPFLSDPDVLWIPQVLKQKVTGGGGGGKGGSVPKDIKYASVVSMPEDGLVVALQVSSSVAKAVNTRMMLYADNGGIPGALVARSEDRSSVVLGTNTYTLQVPFAALARQPLWIAFQTDGTISWFLSATTGGSKFNTDLYADGPSNPFGSASTDNNKAPVFAVFLESAPASLVAGFVGSDDAFYVPKETGQDTLADTVLEADDAFIAPQVVAVAFITPQFTFQDPEEFGEVGAATTYALTPSLVIDSDILLQPSVGRGDGDVFSAQHVDDDTFFPSTVITQGVGAVATLFSDTDILFIPVVKGVKGEFPGGVAIDDVISLPAIQATNNFDPPFVVDVDRIIEPTLEVLGGTQTLAESDFIDSDLFYGAFINHAILKGSRNLLGTSNELTLDGDSGAGAGVNLLGSSTPETDLDGEV